MKKNSTSPTSKPNDQAAQPSESSHSTAGPSSASSSVALSADPNSLQRLFENQQQIIKTQAEVIKALTEELASRKAELSRSEIIKEEMRNLVGMTERAEEEASEQLVVLERKVARLTELLRAYGIEVTGL